jgi:hypothetical protein
MEAVIDPTEDIYGELEESRILGANSPGGDAVSDTDSTDEIVAVRWRELGGLTVGVIKPGKETVSDSDSTEDIVPVR